MKEVFSLIKEKNCQLAQLPLFEFMQDRSIHPAQRLVFAPCLIPLVMGFADLWKEVFRKEPTNNPMQQILNKHTYEEENHWEWLLEDLKKMGLDPSENYTDTVRFLWGEETQKTRQVCFILHQFANQENPFFKLVVAEVAEVTANLFFSITQKVAWELEEITKQEYPYFGDCHLNSEANHNINKTEVIDGFEAIELTEQERQLAFEIVEKGFEAYTEAINEWFVYAQKHQRSPSLQVA
ncbi:MAG: hypothetical protein SAL07_25005 [Oscillatoria sp. PMC 1051.18]|nr:hypothetical protein [Oscillatoria sp. PMC 1050.18]MEC5033167.1 hypothetical protein [Oscillatoria sp. PMC 1051.18]